MRGASGRQRIARERGRVRPRRRGAALLLLEGAAEERGRRAIVTTVKTTRKARSKPIAAKPVFLQQQLLEAVHGVGERVDRRR